MWPLQVEAAKYQTPNALEFSLAFTLTFSNRIMSGLRAPSRASSPSSEYDSDGEAGGVSLNQLQMVVYREEDQQQTPSEPDTDQQPDTDTQQPANQQQQQQQQQPTNQQPEGKMLLCGHLFVPQTLSSAPRPCVYCTREQLWGELDEVRA